MHKERLKKNLCVVFLSYEIPQELLLVVIYVGIGALEPQV